MTHTTHTLIKTALPAAIACLLTACSSTSVPPVSESEPNIGGTTYRSTLTAAPAVRLPQRAQWACADGSTAQTDIRGSTMTLSYQGRQYQLTHNPAARPAIYQNQQIMFASNGRHAVIGAPYSSLITTGCQLQGR